MESSAKVAWLICSFSVVLVTSGCKDKKARVEREAPPTAPQLEKPPTVTSAPAVPSAPSTPAPATTPPSAPASGLGIKVSPEQATSTVRVYVRAGALPSKSHVGALLHRGEVAEIPGMQGQSRCVLVHLAGWTREQLFNPACQFHITRNQFGDGGEVTTANHPARLLQFDEKTQLAALSYQEKFDVSLDVGFHLDKTGTFAGPALALRHSQQARNGSELLLEPGRFTLKGNLEGVLESAPEKPDNERDRSPVVIVGTDKLVGFVSSTEAAGAAPLVPINTFQLKVKVPVLKLLGIAFGKPSRENLPIVIQAEPEDEQLVPERARLRVASVSTPADAQAAGEQGSGAFSAPIRTDDVKQLNAQGKREWRGSLAFPANDGEEATYVLQLSWPSSSGSFSGEVFSHPFTVKLQNKAGSLVASVTGLKNLNEEQAKAQGPTSHFPLEAKVLEFHEMAGGREVLIRLDGPPYWKRFSFTRNDWLPLPSIDLSNAYLTGNLSNLFVLDRGASAIRKYGLDDLKELASVKLETIAEYVGLIGGCNSERAPIQVIGKRSVIALSPENLQRRDFGGSKDGRDINAQRDTGYYVTGDGLGFIPFRGDSSSGKRYHYNGDAMGSGTELLDVRFYPTQERGSGVSSAYLASRDYWLDTVATLNGEIQQTRAPEKAPRFSPRWLVPSAPVIFRLIQAEQGSIPQSSMRLECFSYFDPTPFAEVDVPEWDKLNNLGTLESSHWTAFDPHSLRLATISTDRKQWIVHQIVASKERAQPLLLNWPDTSLTRGSELRFKPLILGGAEFSARLIGAQKSTVEVKEGEVAVQIAADELASLLLLELRVPGKSGDLTYPISVHVFGPQQAFAASVSEQAPTGLDSFAAGFKSLSISREHFRPLKTTLHAFTDPVRELCGPVAGHLVLVTDAGRVDFFSLESRKVVRGVPAPANAVYFAGAEALFEYDPKTRTIARINVPTGQRERTMTLPGNLQLKGLGVGSSTTSPVTMLLEQILRQESEQIGDAVVTLTASDRDIVILDNRTLQGSGWAQPKKLGTDLRRFANPYNNGIFGNGASSLPTSRSGQFVTLPYYFMALGRSTSFTVPLPPETPATLYHGQGSPTGSISGTIVANAEGWTMAGGIDDRFQELYQGKTYVTPCGRYRLLDDRGATENAHLEVRTVENNRPILRVGRLALHRQAFDGSNEKIRRRLRPLGENGPLTALAGGGRILEVVDLDIPRLARELSPTAFHVTSQAPPCMVSSVPMEYQIEVNNPAAVDTYRMRDESPGVTVSPQGLVRYASPRVTQPTRVQIAVEVLGKDGQTVIHQFPIFVLP